MRNEKKIGGENRGNQKKGKKICAQNLPADGEIVAQYHLESRM